MIFGDKIVSPLLSCVCVSISQDSTKLKILNKFSYLLIYEIVFISCVSLLLENTANAKLKRRCSLSLSIFILYQSI